MVDRTPKTSRRREDRASPGSSQSRDTRSRDPRVVGRDEPRTDRRPSHGKARATGRGSAGDANGTRYAREAERTNGHANGHGNGLERNRARGGAVRSTNGASANRSADKQAASGAEAAPATDPRAEALALIPHGHFVLTASYGESHGGVVVRWVQQVSGAPPLVVVAIEKGQPLSPIIRDSRRFVLCQLAPDDRVLLRVFDSGRDDGHDPFLGLPVMRAPSGSPVLLRSRSWLDCELTRHLDVEGNCELYIGAVLAGGVLGDRATFGSGRP